MDEYSTTERVAVLTWRLATGSAVSGSELATMFGMSRQGAHAMLARLSRVLPLYQDAAGRWRLVDEHLSQNSRR